MYVPYKNALYFKNMKNNFDFIFSVMIIDVLLTFSIMIIHDKFLLYSTIYNFHIKLIFHVL